MKRLGLAVSLVLMGIAPAINVTVGDLSFSNVPQAEAGCRKGCHARRHGHGGGHGRVSVRVNVSRGGHGGFYGRRRFPVLGTIGAGLAHAGRFIGRTAVRAFRIATWPFYAHRHFHRGFAYGYGGGWGPRFGGNTNVSVRVGVRNNRMFF